MDITKIGHGEWPDHVHAVIEIPFNSNIKYELDKDSGAIFVDRLLYSAVHYPANYGFVPDTISDDGDPVDILVIGKYALAPGSMIKCRLIGVLMTEDENGGDEKLLAVPAIEIDPTYNEVDDITDISKAKLDRIKNFFETYKMLEPDKWVKVTGFEGKGKAKKILERAIANFEK